MDGTTKTRNARRRGSWRLLAERASMEMDPEKLVSLVPQLNSVLEEQEKEILHLQSKVS
jgi:hypothetical protein